jgi:hypothetical protein
LILDGAKALKAITAVAITITVATLTTAIERIFATRMSSLKVEFEEMRYIPPRCPDFTMVNNLPGLHSSD